MNPISPWLDPAEVRRLAESLLAPIKPDDLAPPPSDAGFDSSFVGFASNTAPTPPDPNPPTAADEPPLGTAERAASLSDGRTGFQPVMADSASSLSDRNMGFQPVMADSASSLSDRNMGFQPVMADSASSLSAIGTTGFQPIDQDTLPACPPAAVQPEPRTQARHAFSERMQRFRDWLSHHFAATGVFVLDRNGGVIFDDSGHGKYHFLARSLATASRQPGVPAGNVHVKIGTSGTLEVIPVETPFGGIILGAVVPDALPPAAVTIIIDALSQAAAPPRRTSG